MMSLYAIAGVHASVYAECCYSCGITGARSKNLSHLLFSIVRPTAVRLTEFKLSPAGVAGKLIAAGCVWWC